MIFGTQAPKFIYDPAGDNVEVLLDYIVVLKDEEERDKIIHESVFTGHRELIIKGYYWIYECRLHLFKYDNPQKAYEDFKLFEGKTVRFFRHRDGDYLQDADSNEVQMFLQSVDEAYYQTTDYKDLLILKFKSAEYIHLQPL